MDSTIKITSNWLKRKVIWDKKELKLASRRHNELKEILNIKAYL